MWDLRDKSAKRSWWLGLGDGEVDITKRILVIRVSMEICHVHRLGIILWIFILQQGDGCIVVCLHFAVAAWCAFHLWGWKSLNKA